MLSVVLIHVADPWRMNPDNWLTSVVYLANSLPRFAVPLFFVFSGFSLSLNARKEGPLRFYRRTLKFLFVPYVIYSLLYSLAGIWRAGDRVHSIANHLWFGTACYHLWFIPTMLRVYILHPFLIRWYRTLKRPGWLVIAGLVLPIFWPAFASLIRHSFPQTSAPLAFLLRSGGWVTAFPTYLGFVILGYYVRDHTDGIRLLYGRAVVLPSLLVWLLSATGIAALLSGTGLRYAGQGVALLSVSLTLAAIPCILSFLQGLSTYPPACRNYLHAFGLYTGTESTTSTRLSCMSSDTSSPWRSGFGSRTRCFIPCCLP